MPLEQLNTVDAIGVECESGRAVLTIADSHDWTDEYGHLKALQKKLNAYFQFIESGQVWDSVPAARDRQLRISVVFRFPPPAVARDLLVKAVEIASELDVLFSHRSFEDTESDAYAGREL